MFARNVVRIVPLLLAALSMAANAVPKLEEPLNEQLLARQDDCGEVFESVAFLQAYNPVIKNHLYTDNAADMENAITQYGYISEGDVGHVFSTQVGVTIPLYRLWSEGRQDNLYTTSESEAASAVNNLRYHAQGTAAFVYSDQNCGSIPLYRMYSPTATDHFYTTSESERDNAITNLGYVDEGIQCYILPTDD